MAATMTTISGSAMAAPANRLSLSAAFRSSGVQELGVVRQGSANVSKIVAARASSNDEDRSSTKPQMLAALVAAGAALALNYAAPVSPAHAGLFDGDTKVARGTTGGDFPGNEGTGTKVGENASVRGSASTGTPVGEASASGSGVDVGNVAAKAKDAVGGIGIDINIDPLKTKIVDISPLQSTLNAPDVSSAGDLKSKLLGGN